MRRPQNKCGTKSLWLQSFLLTKYKAPPLTHRPVEKKKKKTPRRSEEVSDARGAVAPVPDAVYRRVLTARLMVRALQSKSSEGPRYRPAKCGSAANAMPGWSETSAPGAQLYQEAQRAASLLSIYTMMHSAESTAHWADGKRGSSAQEHRRAPLQRIERATECRTSYKQFV